MAYKQLTKSERYYIEQRKANNPAISGRELAKEMNRHHTSINRELARNFDIDFGFYSGIRAETLAVERKKAVNFKTRKLQNVSTEVSSFIFSSLQERTSPEQLCGRLKVKMGVKISHPTFYKHINEDKRNGGKLYLSLRHGKKKYRKKHNKENACAGINKKNIAKRPAVAEEKREPGHWEIDTIFGLDQKSYLLTLSDKATKFEIVRKIANKEAATVLAEIEKIIAFTLLPFKTITSDNGTEFALHDSIAESTGSEFYFADAYSSWQRGLNEHQNGLIRDFYPKKTDFRQVSDADIAKVEKNLNNRPRKSLGFLTPAEAMFNYVTFGRWCT